MTGRACTRPVSLPPITFTFVESSALLESRPRPGSGRRMLAALEALQTLELLQVRHEYGVRRIARQLGSDVERLPGDQRDALTADEVRTATPFSIARSSPSATNQRVASFRQTAHIAGRLAGTSVHR